MIQESAEVMTPSLTSEGDDPVAWPESHHLTTDSIATLRNYGCDTVAIITALESEDVTELRLNMGQRQVLLRTIKQAREPIARAAQSQQQPPPHPHVPRVPCVAIEDAAAQAPTKSLVDFFFFLWTC